MLGIYLFATVLGGGLLLFSVLGGGDHDVHHGVGVGHDAGAGPDHDWSASSGPMQLLVGFFRPRNVLFFLATFGITGTLLTLLDAAGALVFPLSLGMGGGAMLVTHALFTWLARTETGVDVMGDPSLEGCLARVTLPIGPGARGRVVCLIGDREIPIVARLAADVTRELAQGEEVVVLRVTDGEAEVKPVPSELPPGLT